MQYLKTALKYEAGNHPIVHQCLGQSFIALGMLKVCYGSDTLSFCLHGLLEGRFMVSIH